MHTRAAHYRPVVQPPLIKHFVSQCSSVQKPEISVHLHYYILYIAMSQSPNMRGWTFQILNEFKGQYTIAKEPSIMGELSNMRFRNPYVFSSFSMRFSSLYSSELAKCGPDIISRLLDIMNAVLAAIPAQTATSIPNKVIVPLRSPRSPISTPSSPKLSATVLDNVSMDLTTARAILQSFREESHRKILSFHHTKVPRCWRRLFTDATLLMVLADLQLHSSSNPDIFYKGLVGRLDEAIVITNSPGKGRIDMCHDAIARIQDEYLPLIDPASPSTSLIGPGVPYPVVFDGITTPLEAQNINKRPKRSARNAALRPAEQGTWVPTSGRQFPLPSSSSLHVPRLFDPPSVMDFREWYYTKPFIINKYAADWPACANWGSPQYLRAVGGLGRKVPVETTGSAGEDYTSESWTTSLMDWEEFIDALCARSTFHAKPKAGSIASASATCSSRPGTPTTVPPDAPRKRGRPPLNKNLANPPPVEEWSGPSYYLAQHDLINQFPELRGDIIMPDYVYSGVPAPFTPPDQYPDYHPPNVEGNIMINNWIGPKGTVTPAHTVRMSLLIVLPHNDLVCYGRIHTTTVTVS